MIGIDLGKDEPFTAVTFLVRVVVFAGAPVEGASVLLEDGKKGASSVKLPRLPSKLAPVEFSAPLALCGV